MIKIKCDICNSKLDVLGAVLISPPSRNNMVRKFHICSTCYYQKIFFKLLKQKSED